MFSDLHIHSCLSPCADDDMTPYNIAAMSYLKGLDMIALTDHNTARNCSATAKAAASFGLSFIPGIEITTSEEIHVVTLFPSIESAMKMDEIIYKGLAPVKNKPEIFGNQIAMDETDNILGSEERLLLNACSISLTELPALVHGMGGLCIPAHVMRSSGGIIPVLGSYPHDLSADAFEHDGDDMPSSALKNLTRLKNSDAHRLTDILEQNTAIKLPLKSADFGGLFNYIKENRGG